MCYKYQLYNEEQTNLIKSVDFIKLLNLNFNNSKILSNGEYSDSFDFSQYYNPIDEKIVPRSIIKLLKCVISAVDDDSIIKDNEYKKLVLNTLKFCVRFDNNWDEFPESFKCFYVFFTMYLDLKHDCIKDNLTFYSDIESLL